ncbi:MAG: hypothetical protein LBD03_06630 [Methanobrevibacter sp.]|nr:hypothetical protein [Candidatus Methanovirga procula]
MNGSPYKYKAYNNVLLLEKILTKYWSNGSYDLLFIEYDSIVYGLESEKKYESMTHAFINIMIHRSSKKTRREC